MRFLLEESGLHMQRALEPVIASSGMERDALAAILAEAPPMVSRIKWMTKGEPDEATARIIDAMRAATRIDADALARMLRGVQGSVRVISEGAGAVGEGSGADSVREVFWRPPGALLKPAALAAMLQRRLVPPAVPASPAT
jgi:hypothetical protein